MLSPEMDIANPVVIKALTTIEIWFIREKRIYWKVDRINGNASVMADVCTSARMERRIDLILVTDIKLKI